MTKNGKIEHLSRLLYVAVALYMMGLFLLVLGKMFLGFSCVAIGAVTGIIDGVAIFKRKYKPSRQTTPRWLQFFGVKDKI